MKIASSISPFSLPDAAPELARRLALILGGLAGLVARRFLRMPHLMGLTLLLWGRLTRAAQRFERVMARPAGAVRAPRLRTSRAGVVQARSGALPSGQGWLVRELGWEAAGYGCQLEALLADPAMQAALAALPGTGRILRPLCRMLGVAEPAPVVAVSPPVLTARVDPPPPVWPRVGPACLPGGVENCTALATAG